jgi:hypothetical protein
MAVVKPIREATMLREREMKTDLYTKTVLTVIAGCLLYLCAAGPATVVEAQPKATEVLLVGWKSQSGVARYMDTDYLPVRVYQGATK